jgi:hypothetical protein
MHGGPKAPENRRSRTKSLEIAVQRLGHTSLTRRNVGGSPTSGNQTAETELAGWGGRIRTWKWRNQNPSGSHDPLTSIETELSALEGFEPVCVDFELACSHHFQATSPAQHQMTRAEFVRERPARMLA